VVAERFALRMICAVWKPALEFVYLRNPTHAFHPKFDRVRETVIGTRRDPSGWVIGPRQAKPHNNVRLELTLDRILAGEEQAPVRLDVYGVQFYTDLLVLDVDIDRVEPPWPANVWAFRDGKLEVRVH
jgi:hypothetical protein